MPIYEYVCSDCNVAFEKMVTMSKADDVPCQSCGSDKTERKFSVFGVASSQRTSACAGDLPQPSCAAAGPGGGCHGCPGMG